MIVGLVGGIFDRSQSYRRDISVTPESTLEQGLLSRGCEVRTFGHRQELDLRDLDVLHVHHLGRGALRAASDSSRVPLVFTSHDGVALCGGHVPAPHRLAARFVMGRADGVVALSETELRFQKRRYSLEGCEHRVIPNGMDPESLPLRRRNPAGVGSPWRLLFVGQLIPLKRVDVLLRALARLELDWQLDLVYQTDASLEELRGLAGRLGVEARVRFLGTLGREELSSRLQTSDVLVLPSRAESLPSVITEALLSGLPVIASRVGGIPEQLGDFGLLVEPGHPDLLADSIRRMIESYGEFSAKGEAMRRYALDRFSIPRMVDDHLSLYKDLAGRTEAKRSRTPLRRLVGRTVRRGWRSALRD